MNKSRKINALDLTSAALSKLTPLLTKTQGEAVYDVMQALKSLRNLNIQFVLGLEVSSSEDSDMIMVNTSVSDSLPLLASYMVLQEFDTLGQAVLEEAEEQAKYRSKNPVVVH